MARAMKDSGIEWIGEIPKEWELVQLRRFVNINNGREIRREVSKDYSGAIGVYGSGGIFKYTDEMQYSGKAVMFGRKGTLGKPLYVDDSFWTVDTMYFLTYKNGLDERFNYYQLIVFDWEPYITHTAIPSIVASQIVACHFPIPNRCEQNRIAAYLDKICVELDNVLEKTRASIEEYKKLKQAVITQAATKGIKGDREMKDSRIDWIGEIPSEWKIIRIKWVLSERKEKSESGEEEPLSMSQKYGIIPTREMKMIPNIASSFIGAKIVYSGDLVFNKLKAHLGVFAVSQYNGIVSPDYAVYCTKGIADVKYLEYLFKTPQYISEFRKKSSGVGAGLTRLYTDELYSIYCLLPSWNEQEEIICYLNKKMKEIDNLIEKKEQYLSEIENYKKSLIYEYVTGKKGGLILELIENYLCGILDKYCVDENCDKEELSGIRDIRIVKSIWSESENLRPDIAKKQGRDEIEKCDGYLLFLDDETAVILINEVFLFDSIRKNFCWVEVLIHEITHYRDYKNNLGIFGHNTYDSMLNCCSFWYWTEFHARYKGTCQMLNYVNRMPDGERRKYETDMMERLDCAPDFIRSDADKKIQCYRFMHLLGDIAAYNEKGFTIKSGAIEKIFPDYLGYIDFLKSKDQIVDVNFLIILQYNLENEMNIEY